jgi:TPR repeat protein
MPLIRWLISPVALAVCSASALGEPSAMNGLGAIYKDGDGVPRDPKVARQWFEKAAALGNPEAKQNLREMRR